MGQVRAKHPGPTKVQGRAGAEQGLRADLHIVDAFGLRIHHEETIIEVLFGPPPVGWRAGISASETPSLPV